MMATVSIREVGIAGPLARCCVLDQALGPHQAHSTLPLKTGTARRIFHPAKEPSGFQRIRTGKPELPSRDRAIQIAIGKQQNSSRPKVAMKVSSRVFSILALSAIRVHTPPRRTVQSPMQTTEYIAVEACRKAWCLSTRAPDLRPTFRLWDQVRKGEFRHCRR